MDNNIKGLMKLVVEKNKIDTHDSWSKGSITYLEEIKKELEEVEVELKNKKQVFLEDELGDVLWDYLNLLHNLDSEDKISLNKVFERAIKKYSQRIEGINNDISWEEIKDKQKKELKKEQNEIDKN